MEKQLADLTMPSAFGTETAEDRNRALVREMTVLFNAGDAAGCAAYFAEHAINHGFPVPRAVVVAILADMMDTFPDLYMEETHLFAQGDWVTVRCWYGGTHLGVSRFPVNSGLMVNVPPTGRTMRVEHIHLYRFRDGEIIEHYACRDDVEMARQLGLLPPAPTFAGLMSGSGGGSDSGDERTAAAGMNDREVARVL
jgi:predicted ester cyclase